MASHSALRPLALAAVALVLTASGGAFVGPQLPRGDRLTKFSERAAPQGALAEVASPSEPLEVASGALRAVLAVMAALAVAFVPMDGAEAARSGGRMGGGMRGGGFGGGSARRAAPQPRAAPRAATGGGGPNISVGVSPFGFGSPFGYSPFGFGGGFGMPLIVPFGGGGGESNTDRMLKENQRQDERVIDQQKSQIETMQKELAELKASKK